MKFSRSRSRDSLKSLDSSGDESDFKKNNVLSECIVIVCKIENDCVLRSEKPFFIESDKDLDKEDLSGEEEEDDIPILSKRDLLDLNKVLSLDIEAIAISNIINSKEIR